MHRVWTLLLLAFVAGAVVLFWPGSEQADVNASENESKTMKRLFTKQALHQGTYLTHPSGHEFQQRFIHQASNSW